MILYLDTSALVKAYVSEQMSDSVIDAINRADIVASHVIAYVEAHAAFSRLKREKKINEAAFEKIKQGFVEDWRNYLQVDSSLTLLQHASDLSDAFSLRAYDSVHLAAAVLLYRQSHQLILFACFDQRLNKAAKLLGLELYSGGTACGLD